MTPRPSQPLVAAAASPLTDAAMTITVTVGYCERNTSVMQLLQNGTTEKCSARKAQRRAHRQRPLVRECYARTIALIYSYIAAEAITMFTVLSLDDDDDDVCPYG